MTPISMDSEFLSIVDEETSIQHRFSISTINSDHTPIMFCQPPMAFKKGTDFNRI